MNQEKAAEAGVSLVKSIFSAIPYAGGALNEIFFDYRSRIKQNRINAFAQLLSNFFMEHAEIDPESLKTEEFSDIFESVVRRVVMTKSKEKQTRYRDVLIQHIFEPHKSVEDAETYLDLISTLDEMAIRILQEHRQFSADYKKLEMDVMVADAKTRHVHEAIEQLKGGYPVDEARIAVLTGDYDAAFAAAEVMRKEITDRQDFRQAGYFGINDSEYFYYKQTLYAKGLLVDKGFGTFGGSTPFRRMWITNFGEQFMHFLTTGDHD